jgi:hypothetical protein
LNLEKLFTSQNTPTNPETKQNKEIETASLTSLLLAMRQIRLSRGSSSSLENGDCNVHANKTSIKSTCGEHSSREKMHHKAPVSSLFSLLPHQFRNLTLNERHSVL